MRFWNILGWVLGIACIIVLIILVLSGFFKIGEIIKEDNERQKKEREESKRIKKEKWDALPQKEKDRIIKMHKDGTKWLIWTFGSLAFMIIFSLIMSALE